MRITSLFIRTCLLIGVLSISAQIFAETLTIVIENIRDTGGALQMQVLASQKQFEEDDATAKFMAQFREPTAESRVTLTTGNLPAGEYAIKIFHDVNSNGQLDTNFAGLPIEPYAFSNNARGRFGPATWEDAHFVLEDEVTQVLHLVH